MTELYHAYTVVHVPDPFSCDAQAELDRHYQKKPQQPATASEHLMVIGHHVIFGAYGFWLPNDPRGSWSEFVGSWELFRYGAATKTGATRSLAASQCNHTQRLAAKKAIKRPAVEFNSEQVESIAIGFSEYATRSKLNIFACAILPDHVHLVLQRHRLKAEQLAIQLKGAATRRLVQDGNHPFRSLTGDGRPPKCFARGEWKVFLDSEEDIYRSIRYVDNNLVKEGLPRQDWDFVVPYALGSGPVGISGL